MFKRNRKRESVMKNKDLNQPQKLSRKEIIDLLYDNIPYIIAVIVSVYSVLGDIFFNKNLNEKDLLRIILFILIMLATQSLIERLRRLTKISDNLTKIHNYTKDILIIEGEDIPQIKDSINQIFPQTKDEFERLETSISQIFPYAKKELLGGKDWYKYITYRIDHANKSIDDASLSSRLWRRVGSNEDDQFQNVRKTVYEKTKNNLVYRYLTVFKSNYVNYSEQEQKLLPNLDKQKLRNRLNLLTGDLERINMIQENFDKYGEPNYHYYVRYLPQIKFNFPALSFFIIDEKELVLGFYPSEFEKGATDTAIVIYNQKIIDLFSKYFQYLWMQIAFKFDTKEDIIDVKNDLEKTQEILLEMTRNLDS